MIDNMNNSIFYCNCHTFIFIYDKSFVSSYKNLDEGYLEKIESIEQLRCIENNLEIRAEIVNFDSISVDTADDLNYIKSFDVDKFQSQT